MNIVWRAEHVRDRMQRNLLSIFDERKFLLTAQKHHHSGPIRVNFTPRSNAVHPHIWMQKVERKDETSRLPISPRHPKSFHANEWSIDDRRHRSLNWLPALFRQYIPLIPVKRSESPLFSQVARGFTTKITRLLPETIEQFHNSESIEYHKDSVEFCLPLDRRNESTLRRSI